MGLSVLSSGSRKTLDRSEGRVLSLMNRGSPSFICKTFVIFATMLSLLSRHGLVQSFKGTNSRGFVGRRSISISQSSNSWKLDTVKAKQFACFSVSATGTGADDSTKKPVLKKKASLLKRSVRTLSDGPTTSQIEAIAAATTSASKMTKQVEDDLMADYIKTVSRIPTSAKAKKAVVEKVPLVEKVSASKPSSESFNSNSVYTNTEYKNTKGDHDKSDEEVPFEASQLTTSVTNMAFNSLDVSVNTKRALSEVMVYK